MNRKPDPYGRDATRPFQIPLKGWWQVAQRVWSESNRDNLSVVAAGCAFFALFAIFPALSALISLYGLTADPATVEQQFRMLGSVLPAQAYDVVIEQIHRISAASGGTLGWGLALSLGLALWSANAGTQAMMAALNIAYEEPERRSLFRYYLNAFTFTIIGILGGVVMLLAILYVPILFAFAGYSHAFEVVVRVARWPFLALFVLFLLALLYRYGPCRRSAKWHWVSVGSLFAMVVWLIASAVSPITIGSMGRLALSSFCCSGSTSRSTSSCLAPRLMPSLSCRRQKTLPKVCQGLWGSAAPSWPTTWPAGLTVISDR